MKNLCRKISAICGCIAMLVSMAVAPVSAETVDNILINCIDQHSGDNAYLQANWGIWGAIGMKYSGDNIDKVVTASFDFTVEKEGWYDATFIIASYSSNRYAARNQSKVNFWFDNEEPKWLSDSSVNSESPTVETLNYDPLSSSENFQETNLLEEVYLDAGPHTINFASADLNRHGEVGAGFYSIELNYVDVEHIEVLCIDQKNNGYNGVLTETWDGGIGRNNYPTAFNAGFTAEVKKPGWYNVEFITQAAVTAAHIPQCRSKVDWRLDGGEWKNFADASMSDNPTLKTITISFATPSEFSKTQLLDYVYLDEGEHLFEFTTTSTKVKFPAEGYRMGFYSITLDYVDTSSMNDFTLHGGDYPNVTFYDTDGVLRTFAAETNRTNLVDGGKIALIYKNGNDVKVDGVSYATESGFTFTIPFKVYDEDYYDINIKMASSARLPTANYGWVSPAYVGIDGAQPKWVKAYATDSLPEVTGTVVNTYTNATYNFEPAQWQELALTPVKLAPGSHTLRIEIPEQAPNQSNPMFIFAMDSIHIRPAGEKTKNIIEGENLQIKDKSVVLTDTVYRNGSALSVNNAGKVQIPFYVSKTGNYKVAMIANGTASYKVDTSSLTLSNAADLSSAIGSGWKSMKSDEITLDAGLHTLELAVDTAPYLLDAIEISPAIEVSSISVEGTDVIGIGETGEITVNNQDGVEVSIYDVDALAFESSNENVATVDGYGKITAVNEGEAVITVGVSVGGKSLTANMKVYVTGDSGIYVKSATVSGNEVSVTLGASKNTSASKVIVASYNVVNGVKGSLKSVGTVDFETIAEGNVATKSVTLDAIEDSDIINVFVFDTLDTIVPLYGKYIVE